MHRWRAGDPHVDFGRTGFAHHLDDFHAGGTAHDRIVDQHDFLAADQRAVGIMLQLDAEMADAVGRLDKCPADIVGTDDAQFERDSRLFGKSERCGCAAVGNGDDIISGDRAFDRQLGADSLAHAVNRIAVNDRIRTGKIDMFEDAGAGLCIGERTMGAQFAVGDNDQLTGFDAADIFRADQIQRDGFGRKDIGFADPAHDQRTDAERIAAGNHAFCGHANQRISAFDLFQGVDELVE